MAFINNLGQSVSFDCTKLIQELKKDIAEFGGEKLLQVVTEERNGVTIYKDYNFIDDDGETKFDLSNGEIYQKMTATALLLLYEEENSFL